jgi:hypothetical protein
LDNRQYIFDISDKHSNNDLLLDEGPLSELDLSGEALPDFTLEEGHDLTSGRVQGSNRSKNLEMHKTIKLSFPW